MSDCTYGHQYQWWNAAVFTHGEYVYSVMICDRPECDALAVTVKSLNAQGEER